MGITEAFKLVMDTFGAAIVVPIVVFFLSLALKVEAKKALRGALFMGIGLTAFNIILGVLMTAIAPRITEMVVNTGLNLPVLDIGWPAGAAIVYANQLGMVYLILGVGFNVILFLTKVTDTFQPTDIWNYYYFVVWAIMVQFVTGSFVLAVFAAMFMNLIVLLMADWLAPSLQEYYGYEGVTATCSAVTNIAAFAVIVKWVIMKLKIKVPDLNPETIQRRFGFWGESAMIGLILGFGISFLGLYKELGSLGTWGTIFSTALTLGAILVLYPSISGMFVKGLIPITNTMQTRLRSGEMKREHFNIGIDPAIFFGEEATLTTGLLLIPILILTAIILPGNQTLPLADLPAMPFMVIGAIAVFRGNILSSLFTGTIWFSLSHLIATDIAPLFTQAAVNAGVEMAEGATYIVSWAIAANPILYVVYKAFAVAGPLKFLTIGIVIAVYLVALIHFKKNQRTWFKVAGATDEFLDELDAKKAITA